MGVQQWEHLDRSIGDRIMERSANSHAPISMFPSQKHHNTTTEIQQHSKHDDGSVGTRGGDGSLWMGVWGQEHRDGGIEVGSMVIQLDKYHKFQM